MDAHADASSKMDPLELVLRAVAHEAPRSWFPRRVARETKNDLDALYAILELLHLEGLIAPGEKHPEDGPGVVLTPTGAEVLRSGEKLQRLREHRPLVDGDRGGEVRAALYRPAATPWAVRLLWINLAVFAWTCALAYNVPGLLKAFLSEGFGQQDPRVSTLLDRVGGMTTDGFLAGETWRIITSFFVHAGLIHLAFNMMVLYGSGRQAESMWPGWRFLLIYFIGGIGCACFSLAVGARGGVGASGALCGILVAEGWWVWVNRRYLPRSAYRRFAGSFLFNVVVMVFISLQPGIGGLGHLGGAIFGGLAAVFLSIHRYAAKPYRGPALAATLLLPLASLLILAYAPEYNPRWIPAENRHYLLHNPEPKPTNKLLALFDQRFNDELLNLLNKNPARRDPDDVEKAQKVVTEMLEALVEPEKSFARASRYRSPAIVAYRSAVLDLLRKWQVFLTEAQRCFELGEKWTRADETGLKARMKELNASGDVCEARWQDLAK